MDTTEAKVEVTSRNYGPFAVEFDEGEPEVTKTGYTLTDGNHWVNADGAAMSPENVYENAEFFANWRQNAYTVSYNSNKPANASKEIAGTTADSSHLFDRDGETLSQNGYTLQGWTFNGWNTSPDGSGNKFDGSTGNYADMEQVKNLTTEDAKLLELFAQWNANTYHIAYNSNKPANASSLINGTMDDSILTYDTAANLSNLGYSLPGYTWTGWNDMADASGNAYSDGQEVLNLSDTQDAVVTMFAQWKPNTYTVLFDHTSSPVNGDITGDTSKTVTFDDVYGTLPTLNEKTGYTAQGWYTARTDGEKVTETTKVTNPSNHTLFARWTPNSYNISFDVNMGSQANKVAANASVNPGSMSVTYDAAYGTLPVPAWSGWTFKGWNLAPNGTGITRNGSDKVQITSDETVYAQWVDNTAPTFTMNATTGAIASNGTISFANVVEQGSGIAGYYIGQTQPDASGSNVTFGGTTSVTVNNSGTWYMAIKDNAGNMSAVQSVVYYSLTLNADGATNYTTNSAFIKAGTVITLPTGLTKTGYKADTWTGGISSITMNQNGSLFPDWVELPQNWILSIPIAYKIDVGGDIRTTTENIIVTCQNNNISLTGGYSAGGKAVYSWTARGYYYTSNSYFSIGQPTISCNGQTPKDFNISIRINSQIYDYSDWEGYGGGFATDKGNATNQDVSVYCRSGVITYSPTVEIHTSSYGSSTTNDGHTLINEFHLNSMTLILKEFL